MNWRVNLVLIAVVLGVFAYSAFINTQRDADRSVDQRVGP